MKTIRDLWIMLVSKTLNEESLIDLIGAYMTRSNWCELKCTIEQDPETLEVTGIRGNFS